jgi:hypothetical protein
MLSPNFKDILSELFDAGVDFLVVGAFAMSAHELPRSTGDLDLWIRPDAENARRAWIALARFGAPLASYGLTAEELARPGLVFQIGLAPDRIDFLTEIDGVSFDEAWEERVYRELEGIQMPVLSLKHLRINKKATGRPKDLYDAAWIEQEYGSE